MEPTLKIAIQAAIEGGKIIKSYFEKIHIEDSEEKAQNDFVSEADLQSEETIKNILLTLDPNIGFIGEEGGSNLKEDMYWVVDPLDGTKNFLHGFPFFSISIALIKEQKPILGVIYEPIRNDIFYAIRGKGAFLNNKQIYVSKPSQMRLALLATGFPFKRKDKLHVYLEIFRKAFEKFSGIRRAGSAALDLAYTAKGTFSGFFELGLSMWDIAAGSLLVKEAKGIVTDFDGSNNYLASGNIIAGEERIVKALLNIIKSRWKY